MLHSSFGLRDGDGIRTITLDSPHNRNALSARDRFLTKPVRMATMTHAVRELLSADPGRHRSES